MKPISLSSMICILCLTVSSYGQEIKSFDIFFYVAPAGFIMKDNKDKLFYQKSDGKNYCQILLFPSVYSSADVEKDFTKNWDFFARNPEESIVDPEVREKDSINGWQMVFGAARGTFDKKMFAITLSTYTKDSISYYIAAVFTDKAFIPTVQEFTASVVPDVNKFVRSSKKQKEQSIALTSLIQPSGKLGITKSTTNFDDGWVASVLQDYVKLNKEGTEIRLHFIDKALDDARPNTIDAPEYYWNKYVEPYFTVPAPEKWSGVQYPVIYFMQGNAVDKRTGKACFVAIKIVYNGGARPIVVIAPNQTIYEHQFPHPNNIDPMLNANRFAISAQDIIGTWKGSGGGGVEYYNAYSGTFAGMSAVSSTDEFIFNTDGTYKSSYRTASMNSGSAKFGGQDFKGIFSITDWTITATNRFGGKITQYNAQLIAVKGGYLLYMSDPGNSSMNYTLFKSK